MKKLYFKYGVMGSSKSAMALMTAFNYRQQGFNVLLLKPSLDTREGAANRSSNALVKQVRFLFTLFVLFMV